MNQWIACLRQAAGSQNLGSHEHILLKLTEEYLGKGQFFAARKMTDEIQQIRLSRGPTDRTPSLDSAVARQRVKVFRVLFQREPELYRMSLAESLNDLGTQLSYQGNFVEALDATRDAVSILRGPRNV